MKAKEVVQVTSVTVRVLNGAKKLKVGWGRIVWRKASSPQRRSDLSAESVGGKRSINLANAVGNRWTML